MSTHQDLAALVAAGRASMSDMVALGHARVASIKTNPEIPQFRVRADDPISVNSDNRTISYLVSDETPDRMGDIIRVKGWDLANYKRNPVILWAHDGKAVPPIGRANNVRRRYGPNRLTADIEFAPAEAHEFADTIYQLASRGFIKATSVGFLPTEMEDVDEKKRSALGMGPYGQIFSASELMEVSVVSVPANPSALQDGVKALTAEGAFDSGKVARFLDTFPANEEIALARVRAACRSFVDFGAANQLADGLAEPAAAYNLEDPVEKAIPEAVDPSTEEKSPACRMDGETVEECVSRKVPELIEEGMEKDQAVAVANSVCDISCEDKDSPELTTKDVDKLREALGLLSDAFRIIEEAVAEYGGDEDMDDPADEGDGGGEGEEEQYGRGAEPSTLRAVATLIENQAEHTRATRQLVDALSDLTVRLRQPGSDGVDGGCAPAQPEVKAPEIADSEVEDIEGLIESVSRGFAERVRRDLFNNNGNEQENN